MAWSGASNIGSSGFTVDLGELDKVQISEDRNVVSVAAGTTWTDVYNVLSPYNLTVVGGRSAGVGVGGFLAHVSLFLGARIDEADFLAGRHIILVP
jgi:FAD/FMN-containing dehydrogenase